MHADCAIVQEGGIGGPVHTRRHMKLNTAKITAPGLWDEIRAHEGKQFLTKKGLPFTYTIKGGELFTDRRERSITRSTFEKAF